MLFFGSNNIAHLHKRGDKKKCCISSKRERHVICPDSCTALKNDFKIVVDPLCHLQRLPFVIRRVVNDSHNYLEPVCCKKQQKKVPGQLLVCGIGEV